MEKRYFSQRSPITQKVEYYLAVPECDEDLSMHLYKQVKGQWVLIERHDYDFLRQKLDGLLARGLIVEYKLIA